MTATAFEEAFAYTFQNESARYTNDPADSGGPTKYGVTLSAYASFVSRAVEPAEIEALTDAQAYAFYLARYWAPLKCNLIQDRGISTALFDTGVLYGVGTASLLAQKTLCWLGANLKLDGHIGDKSIAFFNLVKREEFLESFRAFVLQRIENVIQIDSKNERFRKGWENRADRLLTLGTNAPFNREVT